MVISSVGHRTSILHFRHFATAISPIRTATFRQLDCNTPCVSNCKLCSHYAANAIYLRPTVLIMCCYYWCLIAGAGRNFTDRHPPEFFSMFGRRCVWNNSKHAGSVAIPVTQPSQHCVPTVCMPASCTLPVDCGLFAACTLRLAMPS